MQLHNHMPLGSVKIYISTLVCISYRKYISLQLFLIEYLFFKTLQLVYKLLQLYPHIQNLYPYNLDSAKDLDYSHNRQ